MALSPMMQHYLQTKEAYPDCILFYRLGDFYEMFFEDAKTVSKELELTLTGKNCGMEERAPMCGVPFHSADIYISKLVEKGYKVAICEQVEDPKTSKGIVKREVIRVVTPGTVLNAEELDETRHNYLMSIAFVSEHFGLAIADISTGECLLTQISDQKKLQDEILKFQPAEIICNQSFLVSGMPIEELKESCMLNVLENRYFDKEENEQLLMTHFHTISLKGLGISDFPYGILSVGALFQYLYDTQKSDMRQITRLTPYLTDSFMLLDSATRRNLELTETLREKQKKGSLLHVLDKTKTAMGARLMRSYVLQPLRNLSEINSRHEMVHLLTKHPMIRDEIREYLHPVYDLERLISKITYRSANPRDLIAFRASLEMLPHLLMLLQELSEEEQLSDSKHNLFHTILKNLDPLTDLCQLVSASICDEPPIALKDGGIIKEGYSPIVDEYREAGKNGKQWLSDLEERERAKTGIRTLKIRYNKIFGYCIEITNSFLDQVPQHYIRRQTLTNAERFTTDELKKMEETILGAEEKLTGLEYELFCKIRDEIGEQVERILQTANAVAMLDVFASLAYVAERSRFVRPKMNESGKIQIKEGRHPVVEQMLQDHMFIANDVLLDRKDNRVAIITGPNMAGKSTYMRQTALIVLMAQIGSFVPASDAKIGIVDRIFTRVGASDDLASGKSTFMIEMNEVANILRNATANSLLILDEIGRGTSTFDGLSIAWAVVEYVADLKKIGAKALFATHYHELTELEGRIPGVKNYCIAVKENGEDIVFLRKIIRGGADRSYGIQVARLAGVPEEVLIRANELASQLSQTDLTHQIHRMDTSEGMQLSIFDLVENTSSGKASVSSDTRPCPEKILKIAGQIREMDLMRITPLEAMNILYDLQNQIQEIKE